MTTIDLDACYEGPEYTVTVEGHPATRGDYLAHLTDKSLLALVRHGAISHLCANPRCLNPRHMRVVDVSENRRGK